MLFQNSTTEYKYQTVKTIKDSVAINIQANLSNDKSGTQR